MPLTQILMILSQFCSTITTLWELLQLSFVEPTCWAETDLNLVYVSTIMNGMIPLLRSFILKIIFFFCKHTRKHVAGKKYILCSKKIPTPSIPHPKRRHILKYTVIWALYLALYWHLKPTSIKTVSSDLQCLHF